MSRSHPWLPWLLVVPMLGGCASLALRPQPASEAAVEVRAEGGRERVTVQQALQQQPSALLYVAAIAGDALLGVNLVRLVLAFQTETAAVQFGLLGAVVGMTGDVLLHRSLAASTDREPHQVRVTTAGGMVLGVALKAAEPGRYEIGRAHV